MGLPRVGAQGAKSRAISGILATGTTGCSLGMGDNTDTVPLLILGYFSHMETPIWDTQRSPSMREELVTGASTGSDGIWLSPHGAR